MNRDTRHNKAMDSTLGRPLSRQAARGSLPNRRRSAIARTALTYFSDLSPCTYFAGRHPVLLAVGWLQRDREYPVGNPGPHVYERLKEYQNRSWQPGVFLGGHVCDLCTYEGFYSHKNIVVPGRDVTYVAPEGIVHYVGCHQYLPPLEFSKALVSAPPAGSPEYFAVLHANGWSPAVARASVVDPKWRRRFQVEAILKRGARRSQRLLKRSVKLTGLFRLRSQTRWISLRMFPGN